MPIANLQFNLPEEDLEFQDAVRASSYKNALWQIAMEVFRPARKHGYDDGRINELIENINKAVDAQNPAGENKDIVLNETYTHAEDLISLLEKRFYDILQQNEVGIE